MQRVKIFFIVIFGLCVFGVTPFFSVAQETNPYRGFLNWHVENFFPSTYLGKPLPSNGSVVYVSLQLTKNEKIIDLSKTSIKWSVNNKFLKGGNGLSYISFIVDGSRGGSYSVKASIQTEEGVTINEFLTVPIVQKEVVLESNAINGKIKPESSVLFTAVPYFFNINSIEDLNFLWKIQKQEILSETKQSLFIQFGTPKTDEQRDIKILSVVKEKNSVFDQIKNESILRIE